MFVGEVNFFKYNVYIYSGDINIMYVLVILVNFYRSFFRESIICGYDEKKVLIN